MIVLLETIHPDAHRVLEEVDDVRLTASPVELDVDIAPTEVRAIVLRGRGRVPADWFERLGNLRVVGRCGAGLDNIDTRAAQEAAVAGVHAPGSTTAAVSEHALMLMLALARRLPALDTAVGKGLWAIRDGYEGMELRGKRLGVVGLGGIGRMIADIGTVLGMDTVYWSQRSRHPTLPMVSLEELLSTSDVIQLCVASAAETVGLIGPAELAAMKPTALVVNTARGNVVDHEALRRALDANSIGGYAADVWDIEPPGDDDPLLADARVIVTPHVAALTDATYREICLRPARSIALILTGHEPDPTTVFRS